MRDELRCFTKVRGGQFVITDGTGRLQEWFVACLDFLMYYASPKGE